MAVIGTGASAAQMIPEVQKTAATMAIYQRSPGHVLSRDNFEFPAWVRWAFRNVPLAMTLYGMFVRKLVGSGSGSGSDSGFARPADCQFATSTESCSVEYLSREHILTLNSPRRSKRD